MTATPTGADTATIDKTYSEILTALTSGQIPIMNVVVNGECTRSLIFNRIETSGIEFLTTEYILDSNSVIVKILNAYVTSDNTTYIEQFAYTASAVNE